MKYHIITYGCQMNESDSERLAAKLDKQKNKPAKNIKQADLVVINICSVRQSAVNRVYSKIKQISKNQPKTKIILTGCILEKDKKQLKEQVFQIWPIVDFKTKAKCQSSKHAFIPIMTGCNNFCSYCAVPYVRGREKSGPALKIINEVKDLIKNGYKEITLLGQNVNSYKSKGAAPKTQRSVVENDASCEARASFSKQTFEFNFPKLLKILNDLPGNFQINFLTSHPKDMSDQLIQVITNGEKISKKIHLPIQSGDNQILKKMNRHYTVEHYKKLVKKIRQAIPQAEISTDIIVGFPNETKKQFQNTIKLVKEMNFSQVYVSAYSPRNGTAAALKLKDNVPPDEKKKRKRILLDLFPKQYK